MSMLDFIGFICGFAGATAIFGTLFLWLKRKAHHMICNLQDTIENQIVVERSLKTERDGENLALFTPAEPNWQTMDRGIFLGDRSFVYSNAGAGMWRGSDGKIKRL